MVERLPEISNQPQSLEETLKARGVDSLPSEVESFMKEIEELTLDSSQKMKVFVMGLYIESPNPEGIADLLKGETEEINELIKQAYEDNEKNEELNEIISCLTRQGERSIAWDRQEQKPLTPELKEAVRRLRKKGLTYPQIAKELKVKRSRVDHAIAVLTQEGKIKGIEGRRQSGARNSS